MIGTIRLGNKRAVSDFKPEAGEVLVNIDRPNILGNPFRVDEKTCRATAILAFKIDLGREIKRRSGLRYDAICEIVGHLLAGRDVILMCWCHPLDCHGRVIKEIVEQLVRG